jgi:hypothetical protein
MSDVKCDTPTTPSSPCDISKTSRYGKRHYLSLFVECNSDSSSSSSLSLDSINGSNNLNLKVLESVDIDTNGNVSVIKNDVPSEIVSMTYSVIPCYESYPEEWRPYVDLVKEHNDKITNYTSSLEQNPSTTQIDRYLRSLYAEYESKLCKLLTE